jgi:hypothetical protein
VTATGISQVALGRAAQHAATAEVANRIDWQQHDLGARTFDLVSASSCTPAATFSCTCVYVYATLLEGIS